MDIVYGGVDMEMYVYCIVLLFPPCTHRLGLLEAPVC